MSNLSDALSDLRAALQNGQDRETAVRETASEYGLNPALLTRLSADMPTTALPTAKEAGLDERIAQAKAEREVTKAVRAMRTGDQLDRLLGQLAKTMGVENDPAFNYLRAKHKL